MTEVALSPRLEPLKMGVFGAKLALERQDSGVRHSTQTMEQYVRSKGGKRAITKILIANNGIAAVKAIRSIRKWAYETFGNDRIIEFVAMATPEDLKANAAYIHLADEFVNVPGGTNNNNYANVMLIADIAERCGAHAVWAGWGHASENPKLPEALAKTKNKCVWMGPPPSAMRALGDKIGSTLIAQSAGVPCMAWSGDGLAVNYAESGIPDDIYQQSCVTNAIQAEQAAQRIGYPIMIKASEGGGGKGIRKVEKQEDVKLAFAQVQGEVPGSPIFLMKLAPVCRHLEVQLLADEDGEAIAVHGRDCSIQRRHQKIIEEGPVVAAPPEIWRRMEQSAVRLAKEVGYVGAGTVEYLYMDTGDYCFLELNPRLQVEHPVTELISGVNLPAAQLQIAMGIPLRNIRGVRRMYGEDPDGSSFIDFEKRHGQTLPGHVIACRVTAENPDEKFQPTSGVIVELNFRSTPNVWGYFSVAARGGVHEFSDSQFGHMFALGETREIARTNMVLALKELSIRGDIRTTVEYLSRILETEDFICNRITTTWLEKVMAERTIEAEKPKTHLAVIMGALFRAFKSSTARLKEYMGLIERGQLPSSSLHAQLIESDVELIYEKIKYKFKVTKSGPNRFDLSINDWMVSADCLALSDDGILVLVDGKKHVVYGQEFPVGLRLIVDGKTCLFHEEYDPTQLRSSMQGKLVRYLIPDGAHILKEKPYAEIEVMKMYITLMAPESGILKTLKPEGSIIEAGDLLATLTLDEPDKIQRAELFLGTLPRMREPHHIGDKSSAILADALKRLHMLLSGYQLGPGVIKRTVDELLSCLRDPSLPLSQFKEILSTLSGRIPIPLFDAFQEIATDYAKAIVTPKFYWESGESFPVSMIQDAITSCQQSLSDTEKSILTTSLTTSGVFRLIEQYRDGNETYVVQVLTQLFEEYFEVENYFHGEKRPEMVIKELRKSFHNDLDMVARIARAHHQIGKRNELILMLLHVIEQQLAPLLVEFMPLLKKLTALVGKEYASIVVKARQLIMKQELPSSSQRRIAIQTILNGAAGLSIEQRSERLSPLIDQSQPIEDLIFDFFEHKRPAVQLVAMEVYIRRVYQVYHLSNIQVDIVKDHGGYLRGYWSFYLETERGRCDSDMDQRTIASHMSKLSEREVQQKINMLKSESVKDIEKLRSPIASTSALSKMVDESEEDIFDTHGTQTPPVGRVLPKPMKSNVAKHKAARCGVMAFFKDIECAKRGFLDVLTIFDSSIQFMEPVHVLYIGVKWSTKLPSDESLSQQLKGLVKSHQPQLQEKGVRRVTFIVTHGKEEYPAYFTFRHNLDYSEDTIIRHIEPSYALHMQLQRLSNFEIRLMSTTNRLVHLFAAIPQGIKADANTIPEVYDGRRFFVRSLVRKLDSHSLYPSSSSDDDLDAYPETEFAFVEALNALEMAIAGEFRGWRENSIFLNVLVEAVVELDYIEAVIRLLARRYSDKIRRLNIAMVELCISLKPHADSLLSIPYRFVCTNPTGYVLNITIYEEKRDPTSNKIIFHTQGPKKGIWDGQEIYTPYPISLPLMKQRSTAWAAETLYVYDYITLFEHALARAWQRHNNKKNGYAKDTVSVKESVEIKQNDGTPSIYITSVELILDPTHTSLIESTRVPGINDVGMIAWKWMIYTPEYPKGRSLIVIANDITYQAGTFGTTEDLVFDLASKYARKHGLPRIYIAANSGARIGLAEELRHKFRIAWNQGDVSKGMSYLYLTPEDYQQYKDCVIANEMTVPEGDVDAGQMRYAIHDIIGRKHGLGVENLRGSGTIAGETSCAYEEIFTLTYVAGRSVGIGAYLARLGQRVIQKEPQPIILTGYNALNKLLGKTVYTSNVQLGGPDIMYTNGVSHQTVDNDMHGVQAILSWLSYVPAVRHQSFVATATKTCDDPIERRIAFRPGKNPYDPRHLCAGMIDPTTQTWISGFFDQHSFIEILGGWARSVVVGRARLGGIPMGVIVVETRTIEQIRPADPANPESKEQTLQRAGQVWYPDSAFKTAQGIRDMITEDIPLMIFANWRGFSGGMQDMFDEILKFGSYIVDALRAYRHPVFVYIPPYGTLRGGAWVVVDSTINEQYMEMYADESGRGGVLETEGTLDVKFRKKDILVLCHRLDPVLMKLDQELNALNNESKSNTTHATTPSTTSYTAPSSSQRSATQIRADIAARERIIFPLYHQTAAAFADLHDTPGRMQAKGCIHGMVRWEEARTFFYHRLQRRNAELNVISRIQQADPSYKVENGWKRALSLLHEWVVRDVSSTYSTGILSNDQLFAGWLDSHQPLIDQSIQQLHIAYQQQQLSQIIQTIPNKELVNGLAGIITGLTDAQKQQLKKALQLS